jgi:hypothetical protein
MSGRRPVVNIVAESLSQHEEKHVVTTLLSGVRVGKRKKVQSVESDVLLADYRKTFFLFLKIFKI